MCAWLQHDTGLLILAGIMLAVGGLAGWIARSNYIPAAPSTPDGRNRAADLASKREAPRDPVRNVSIAPQKRRKS